MSHGNENGDNKNVTSIRYAAMFLNSFHALTKSCMKCGPDDDACSICNHCIILIFLFIDQKKFRNMETNKIYKTEYSKIAENQKSIKPLKNKTKKK